MAEEQFGRPIDKDSADKYFKKYISIKKRYAQKVQRLIKSDNEVSRYYSGRQDMAPELEDWAFVFDKASLTRIMKNIENAAADGIFIFYGAKDLDGVPADQRQGSDDTNGRPTLMIFPYLHTEAVNNDDVEFTILKDNGEQYPGTGGGKEGIDLSLGIPDSFTKGQYHI